MDRNKALAQIAEAIKAGRLSKANGKLAERMIQSVEAGKLAWSAWETCVQGMETLPKRSVVEGGHIKEMLDSASKLAGGIFTLAGGEKIDVAKVHATVELLVEKLDAYAETVGKRYRIVINARGESKAETAPAPATAGKGKGK